MSSRENHTGDRGQQKETTNKTENQEQNVDNITTPPDVHTPTPDRKEEATEDGWGWVVVFSSFVLYMLLDGTGFSMGVLFNALQDAFGSSNSRTAWLASAFIGTYSLVGPVASASVRRFGCRAVAMFGSAFAAVFIFVSSFSPSITVVIITFGFLAGFGMGFNHVASVVSVGHLFTRRRALATGIVCCGGGIGTFAFAPLFDFLLKEYGWRGTLWIHSAIVLNGILFSFAYRCDQTRTSTTLDINKERSVCNTDGDSQIRVKDGAANTHQIHSTEQATVTADEKGRSTERSGKNNHVTARYSEPGPEGRESQCCRTNQFVRSVFGSFDVSLMKSPVFLPYWFSVFLWTAGLYIPPTFLPPLAHDLGIDSTRAAFLVSIIGITNTVGRVIVGFVSDQPWGNSFAINCGALVVCGVATSLVPFLNTFPLLAAYSAVFGSCISAFVTLRTPILVELLGLEKFTNAFGFLCLAHGFGAFLGAPLAGFLSDETGDYSIAFHVTGVTISLAGVICLPLRCLSRGGGCPTSRHYTVSGC